MLKKLFSGTGGHPAAADASDIPLDGSTIRVAPEALRGAMHALEQDQVVHVLSVTAGTGRGLRIPLAPGRSVLGRAEPADIVLNDPKISRRHLELRLEAGNLLVRDLGSTNGSYIDDQRIEGEVAWPVGATLLVGGHALEHERSTRQQLQEAQDVEADLERASHYVRALLPAPIADGPVRTDWLLKPSWKLGGDALGYHQIDDNTYAFYLLDVSGHGVGAAMHSVSVLNVLRQRSLPDTDVRDPAAVLTRLNTMFAMEAHDGMYLTMWYGVYEAATRRLTYVSAGHHPGYLSVGAGGQRTMVPLQTRNLVLGAMPGYRYRSDSVQVTDGARLYLFSDGAFEIVTASGLQWGLRDFLPLLEEPPVPGKSEPQRLYEGVSRVVPDGLLEDDFSALTVTFL